MSYTIHSFNPKGKCQLSGKEAEVVEISSDDGFFHHSQVSFNELRKLLRFRETSQANQGKGTTPEKPT